MNIDARVEALEVENERLRDRIVSLEEALGMAGFLMPPEWRLTGKETAVLGCLYRRDVMTKQNAMLALYDEANDETPDIKIIDVFVCKLRKKVKPFGVEIATIWGVGYRLGADAKAIIRTAAGEDVARAA